MSEKPSPRSGTVPPRSRRFGEPGGNPTADKAYAAKAKQRRLKATDILSKALDANEEDFDQIVDDPETPFIVRRLLEPFKGRDPLTARELHGLVEIWDHVFKAPGLTRSFRDSVDDLLN